jgi:hypothetical protein
MFSSIVAGVVWSVGYLLGSGSYRTNGATASATGKIEIDEVQQYDSKSWAATIPALTPVLRAATDPTSMTVPLTNEPPYIYTVTTEALAKLTYGKPRGGANVKFDLGGKLNAAVLYLFLEQEVSSSEVKYVVLQQVQNRTRALKVPAGGGRDRLRGLLVSRTAIPEYSRSIPIDLTLRLEKP